MNRTSEYIKNSMFARQLLKEAKIKHGDGKEGQAVYYLIEAFDAFIKATNNAVSIRDKVKIKRKTK